MIRTYINMPYKKENFLAFLKKLSRRKGKNPILVYPGLRYAHKKLNFVFDLRLKKLTKKFRAISKLIENFFVVAIKKMLVIHFL